MAPKSRRRAAISLPRFFMIRDEVIREIYIAIGRVNELRPPDERIECREDTVLYGEGGCLDSLELVSLILDVEMAVNERIGANVILADARAMSLGHNPFRAVKSLANYVTSRFSEVEACHGSQRS